MTVTIPTARPVVADPSLVRLDWLSEPPRVDERLWLDRNENADPELAAVIRQVLDGLPAKRLFSYPDNGPAYRNLAAHLGVAPEQLLFSAGSDGAIRAAYEAFIEPGDKVVHTDPTFAMYGLYGKMYGAESHAVAYGRSNTGPVLDVDAFIDTIGRVCPKLVCLPNPDSPTGTVVGEPDLRRIVDAAGTAGALILVDEAYYPFYPFTAVPWIADNPHLVVTRSTAKAWGMAGLRIGYAVASIEVSALLHKVRPMYETNTVAVAVLEAMLDRMDAIDASVARLEAGKDTFIDAMNGQGLQTLRCHGNFLHVAFGARAEAVHRALEPHVYYRRDFGHPCLQGFSRFSTTTPELFAPLIDIIKNA